MPTYEYRCPKGHDFEKFYRTISASESEVACPTCGEMATRLVSGGAGLVFKGSGFYLTDYGKNAHATRGGSKPPASSGESAKTGGDAGKSGGDAGKSPTSGGSDTKASGGATSGADKSTPKKGD